MTIRQTIINRLTHRFSHQLAQSKRRAFVKSALIAIANRHPDWADVGFDEHFVAHQGAPLFTAYFRSGQLPDAASLADAWSNQYKWLDDEAQRSSRLHAGCRGLCLYFR